MRHVIFHNEKARIKRNFLRSIFSFSNVTPSFALRALQSLEAAARHRSFARAAEELHVTPAAISQQIKQLEGLLGYPLFKREGGGLQAVVLLPSQLPAL